jgi:hypothetical protein
VGNALEYQINLRDGFSSVAEKVAMGAIGVGLAASKMAKTASDAFGVMTGDFSKLGNLFSALPGPIGVVGQAVGNTLGKMLQDTIDTAEGFRKLNERTGASVEFLSGFTEAADDMFIKSETVSASLSIFAKKLGGVEDAMDGSGISAGAFSKKLQEIGVNSDNVEEALLTVADRFAAMKDGTEKSALAVQLFGKQGLELIPILNKGRAGINEMSAAAKEMGLVMTGETIEAVKEMKRNQDELNDTVEGFARRLAMGVIPELNKFSKALLKSGDSIDDFSGNKLFEAISASQKTAAGIRDAARASEDFYDAMGKAAKKVPEVAKQVSDAGTSFETFYADMLSAKGAIVSFGGAMSGAVPPTQAMKDAALGVNSAVGEMPLVYDNAMKATAIYKLATGQLSFETFKQETATRAVTKALFDGKITTEEAAALYQGLADKSIKTEDALKRTGQAGKDAAVLIDEMNAAMGRVKSKDISLTFTAFRTPLFNDAVGTWGNIQDKTVNLTVNAAAGDVNLPTPAGGGNSSPYGSGGNNEYGGARAKGGPVKRNKPYLVGEQGPEMFVPYASGYVVPNSATPYVDPGTKVSQSFSVNNPSIIIQSTQGAAIAQQIARQNANVARRARARASLMG